MAKIDDSRVYISTTYEFSVHFYDLDPVGVMWHGHYVKYMEDARMYLLDQVGYNYDKHIESGYVWPVAKMNLKYKRPLKMGQKVLIVTDLIEYDNCLRINYKMLDKETGELLTTAQTTQLPVDVKTKRPSFSTPEVFVKLVKEYLATHKN